MRWFILLLYSFFLQTLLPASSKDIYYRDEIGNISTSSVRRMTDAVELTIQPRFPLFGGWRTDYVLGYNVPAYQYLYASGNSFAHQNGLNPMSKLCRLYALILSWSDHHQRLMCFSLICGISNFIIPRNRSNRFVADIMRCID
uniref:Dolichyl-diphosphooligosaccharide--protein glycosyltransferase subunit 1 n=1 Tax=Parascaris equorum TaxID=6256 RepID=A0A914R9B4_PAREQ